jgi:hypothetical protein
LDLCFKVFDYRQRCKLQILSVAGTKEFVCSLSHTQGNISGDIIMTTPKTTPKEYRLRARECLELTDEANEWYVKTALLQLAAEFQRRAERLEHSNES